MEWSEVDEHLNKVALRDGNASAIAYSLLVERDRAEKGKANSPTLKDPLDQFQARQSIPKTKEPIRPLLEGDLAELARTKGKGL